MAIESAKELITKVPFWRSCDGGSTWQRCLQQAIRQVDVLRG